MKFSKKYYRLRIAFFKITSALFLGSLVIWMIYSLVDVETEVDAHAHPIADKYEVAISDPIFEGADKRGKNYQLTSKSLTRAGDNLYDLNTVAGRYKLGQIHVDLSANNGKMDDSKKLLHLLHDIVIEYKGYILKTEQMDIDLAKMAAKNNNEVSVLYHNSNIRADKFRTDSDSGIIYFEGNVLTHFKISDF